MNRKKLPRILVSGLEQKGVLAVDPAEAHHLRNVLRVEERQEIVAIDGKGLGRCGFLKFKGSKTFFELDPSVAPLTPEKNESTGLILEVALPKQNQWEKIVQSAVELGVDQLQPVIADHTDTKARLIEQVVSRWTRLAHQSLKQCTRLQSPTILEPKTLSAILAMPNAENRVVFDRSTDESSSFIWGKDRLERALIGPEGGWSAFERCQFKTLIEERKLLAASAGPLILKTETACALAAAYARLTLEAVARDL